MKKLFILAAAAIAFASCSNDEVISQNTSSDNQQKQIAFTPVATPQTKSADTYQYSIDGTTFPTELNMYVAAYQVEPTATNYFAGTQFIYNNAGGSSASSGYWGGATPRYWPLSACYINFLAYANVTGAASFHATTPASSATVVQSDNSSAQTDLMYAIGHGAVTKSGNDLTFPDKVTMQFYHAQAWMDFYVKANSSVETAITINSITLKGAYYSGTYNITHTNYNATSEQSVAGAWSSRGSQGNVVVPGWSATALTTSLVHVGKGLMIVPDDDAATADWGSFVINYTYDDKTYDFEYELATAAAKSVEQKKHYIYNITFKLHEIFVEGQVVDWTDATQNITIDD